MLTRPKILAAVLVIFLFLSGCTLLNALKKPDVSPGNGGSTVVVTPAPPPAMGARPMQRLIQETIRRALADELLFGRLMEGGRLTVDLDDKDEVILDIQPLPKKDTKASKSEPAEPEEAQAN